MVEPAVEISWLMLGINLAGGLTLFLIGMTQITSALKSLSGTRLRSILQRVSGNRVTGALTGAVTTAALQSSSVTTVLAVSFVSAGLFALPQAAAVIIGSNLGTTVTAQIVSLNASAFSLAIVSVGGVIAVLARSDRTRASATAVIGLGLVFLGLEVMTEAMTPLRGYEPVVNALGGLDNVWLGLLAGAVIAAVIQSSSATTGIAIVLASSGLITLPGGIAIVLGANIGTCVTAILAALGHGRDAMRAAVIHVLVNLLGAIAWVLLIDQLVPLVEWISGSPGDAATATPREIANAHTIFNVINTAVFLALLTPIVAISRRIVPDARVDEVDEGPALFPDADAPIVIEQGTQEVERIQLAVREQLATGMGLALSGSATQLEQALVGDRLIDERHERLIEYLARADGQEMSTEQRTRVRSLRSRANILNLIANVTVQGMLRAGNRRLRDSIAVSEPSRGLLTELHDSVVASFDCALAGERGEDLAQQFADADDQLNDRLLSGSPGRSYALELSLLFTLQATQQLIDDLALECAEAIDGPESPGVPTDRLSGTLG